METHLILTNTPLGDFLRDIFVVFGLAVSVGSIFVFKVLRSSFSKAIGELLIVVLAGVFALQVSTIQTEVILRPEEVVVSRYLKRDIRISSNSLEQVLIKKGRTEKQIELRTAKESYFINPTAKLNEYAEKIAVHSGLHQVSPGDWRQRNP